MLRTLQPRGTIGLHLLMINFMARDEGASCGSVTAFGRHADAAGTDYHSAGITEKTGSVSAFTVVAEN